MDGFFQGATSKREFMTAEVCRVQGGGMIMGELREMKIKRLAEWERGRRGDSHIGIQNEF